MSGGIGTYAVKKRKKPVQKIPKPPPPDGVKSNPSKRHRDRLNGELDKLTNLLPFSEDVRARLDKLSVLRLSVGYLKVKSFFNATIRETAGGWLGDRSVTSLDGVSFSEGDLLLQALNGFVMVVTAEGYAFYASPTIQDYLGFHQSDVVHQSVFELIHTDDRAMFRRQLHFALNPDDGADGMQNSSDITRDMVNYNPQNIPPENSSFLERSFCCRFRCLLDNSSGFLALNFQGRLKYLHGQNKMAEDGTMTHPQLGLFVIATPLQPPSIMEIRSKTLLFQTKHKLDFTPMGIDTRGKVVLGYTEIELCMRGSGYQFIHAADMMYCADNHIRMIKTGESGLTVFRLLSKGGMWIWVQANARLVYKQGRPDFIIARQRALTNEEGEEHLRQRKLQLPFNCTTGEGVLYEVGPTLDIADIQNQNNSQKMRKPASLDPNSLLGCMQKQDHLLKQDNNENSDSNSQFDLDKAFRDSHALLTFPGNNWQPSTPNIMAGIKEESVVKDMMETLQQIMGDSTLCDSLQELDVDSSELKEWESTLLKMSSDMELSEIITNDILSYVEDALFKENGIQLPGQIKGQGQFVEVPECLPEMELPNALAANQGFNGQPGMLTGSPGLGGFIGMNVQEAMDTGIPGRGMAKLTHMGPQIPIVQQTLPDNSFVQSFGLDQMPQNTPVNNHVMFNSSLGVPCSQQQTQDRLGLHGEVQENGLVPCGQIQIGNQSLPNIMTLPPQNSLLQGASTQPMAFTNRNSLPQQQSVNQNPQWVPSVSDSNNVVDNRIDTCARNVSLGQDAGLHSDPTTHLQGQFSLHTQNAANPGLPAWSQSPSQQLPKSLSGRHQNLTGLYGQIQRDPLGQLMPKTNAQGFGSGFVAQTTANNGYPQQGGMVNNSPHQTPNSCMFVSAPQPAVNGIQYGSTDPTSMSTCQRAKSLVTQSPTQTSCYYQRGPSESIVGTSIIPQEDTNINPMACQVSLGLTPESIIAQQYLSCNGQTQIANHPLEVKGPFHLPSLANGTTYFSENNQGNHCDY
ncbi:aryl hydrocarbon receptor 2 [Triplophysa rosa]|uniref:aryl hydrocarbon receptor 2 n=1 Tax=Triplophysa rosa TaxID=992332 RepID=UPI002545E99E|nr:aryl hydrocarbon receptor 2 [Triplophysa rosa]